MSPKELDLIDRLGRISQRINELADVELALRSFAAGLPKEI